MTTVLISDAVMKKTWWLIMRSS